MNKIKTAIKLIVMTIKHWFSNDEYGKYRMCEGCKVDWRAWCDGETW